MLFRSEDTFTFYSDIDSDGVKERVRYFKDNLDFKKGIIEPTGDPLEYVLGNETISTLTGALENVDPIFNYYDRSEERRVGKECRSRGSPYH